MNKQLGNLLTQIRETWQQLGLNQKINVSLAGGVVLIGLLALAFFTTRTGYSTLTRNLSDEKNSKVIAMLDEEKVPYRFSPNGSNIEVPSSNFHRMKMKLAEKRIRSDDGKGWKIFDEPNLGQSETIIRINTRRALQEELAMTIRQFDEVESARVVLTMPENRLLLSENSTPTAAIFVNLFGGELSSSTVNAIQFLVRNSVPGLEIQDVSVMDNAGHVLSGTDDENSISGLANSQLAAAQEFEKHYTSRIQSSLDRALGRGKSIVNVHVALNTDTISQTAIKYDPDTQVVLNETTTEEMSNDTSSDPAMGAGLQANISAATNSVSTIVENSGSTNKVTDKTYAVDQTTSTMTQTPGTPRSVSAAVLIDVKYDTGTNGVRQIVPRTPEEIQRLKNHVATSLGIEQEVNVSLEEMEFDTSHFQEMSQQFRQIHDRQFYFDIGKQSLYILLPLVIFFAFTRMLKRTSIEDIPMGIPLGENEDASNDENNDEDELIPGVVTVDVLNRLIRDNPDNMTQAVRNWLQEDTAHN